MIRISSPNNALHRGRRVAADDDGVGNRRRRVIGRSAEDAARKRGTHRAGGMSGPESAAHRSPFFIDWPTPHAVPPALSERKQQHPPKKKPPNGEKYRRGGDAIGPDAEVAPAKP